MGRFGYTHGEPVELVRKEDQWYVKIERYTIESCSCHPETCTCGEIRHYKKSSRVLLSDYKNIDRLWRLGLTDKEGKPIIKKSERNT